MSSHGDEIIIMTIKCHLFRYLTFLLYTIPAGYCGIRLSDDKHHTNGPRQLKKTHWPATDIIVTQLLRYHMPLLYFVCNHLILLYLLDLFNI